MTRTEENVKDLAESLIAFARGDMRTVAALLKRVGDRVGAHPYPAGSLGGVTAKGAIAEALAWAVYTMRLDRRKTHHWGRGDEMRRKMSTALGAFDVAMWRPNR